MMRRTFVVVGITAAAIAVVAVPAHAGGKRLPKPIALVNHIRVSSHQTPFVRTVSTKPAPAPSEAVRVARPYNPSHFIREAPPAD
jgi:hypothetical protein